MGRGEKREEVLGSGARETAPLADSKPTAKDSIYTVDEVAKHNSIDDVWIIIDDVVYDSTQFVSKHPGGPVLMSYAGMDATDVFHAMHPEFAFKWLPAYRIGVLDTPNATPLEREFREMRQEMKNMGLFDKTSLSHYFFYGKLVLASLLMWAFAVYAIAFKDSLWWNLPGVIVLATFWQQNGWLSHDFLHYAVFEKRGTNWVIPAVVGAVGSGYSYIWWSRKHNTHHAVPNIMGGEPDGDPDIDTMPFLAWCEDNITRAGPLGTFARFWVRYQHIFFLPLLSIARISWNIQATMTPFEEIDVWQGWRWQWKYFEAVFAILYWSWTLGIFFLTMSPGKAFALYMMAQCISGLALAGSFVLNHSAMPIYEDGTQDKLDFSTLQILTGRDIQPGMFNNWFTGGLNFQVEHHLYPRMPRHSYPVAYEMVKKFCKEHNIKHHTVGFWTGLWEVIVHLREVGSHVDEALAKQE